MNDWRFFFSLSFHRQTECIFLQTRVKRMQIFVCVCAPFILQKKKKKIMKSAFESVTAVYTENGVVSVKLSNNSMHNLNVEYGPILACHLSSNTEILSWIDGNKSGTRRNHSCPVGYSKHFILQLKRMNNIFEFGCNNVGEKSWSPPQPNMVNEMRTGASLLYKMQ